MHPRCRNCIVTDEIALAVKIGDLAMGVDAFADDYSEVQGQGRWEPIRWQAWETVVLVSHIKFISFEISCNMDLFFCV